MSIRNELSTEFSSQLKEVNKMEVGTEEYKIAMDGITKMVDRIIELDKIEAENNFKYESFDKENEFKRIQMRRDFRDKMIKNVIDGTKVIGGFGLTAWAFVASINFEKEGHLFSTEGGRAVLKSVLRFMK